MTLKFRTKGIGVGAAILLIAFVLAMSFLITSLLFWVLTVALEVFGVVVAFTWSRAFAFWIICAIVKMIFGGSSKKENG